LSEMSGFHQKFGELWAVDADPRDHTFCILFMG